VLSSLPVILPADTLKVKYQFFNPMIAGNSFICQMTDTSGNENTFTQIGILNNTNSIDTFKIILSNNSLCGNKYKVRVLSTNPADTSINSSIFEIKNPPPKPTITQTGNQLTCVQTFTTYQWLKNDTIIAGATSQSYLATASGSYRVWGIKNNCASDTSDAVNVSVTVIINPPGWTGLVFIFPNPFSKQLYIVNDDPFKRLFLQLYDVRGRILMSQNLVGRNTMISTDKFANGPFLLILTDKNKNETFRKVIIKI
jgi:hypothetical protein